MRTLYEHIIRYDLTSIWKGMITVHEEMTADMLEASIDIHEKIKRTAPISTNTVLVGVRKENVEDSEAVFFVFTNKDMKQEKLKISIKNLGKVLGVMIPDALLEAKRDIIVAEMYRILIHERLRRKKKFRYREMLDTMLEVVEKEDTREHIAFENLLNGLESDLKTVDKEFKDKIREQILNDIPFWDEMYEWKELLKRYQLTEETCKALFPQNPPDFDRMREKRNQLLSEMEEKQNSPFGCREGYIVIKKNTFPKTCFPIIYLIDSEGNKEEFNPMNLRHLGDVKIIIQDEELKTDLERAVGLILLYYTYPLRMRGQVQREQISLLLNCMRQFCT